jgi:hypothetical protein
LAQIQPFLTERQTQILHRSDINFELLSELLDELRG